MASSVAKQLRRLRVRARQHGLLASLSTLAWLQTVEDFQGRCAYCDRSIGFTIDHFQPMMLGGSTSIENCLPCCPRCNQLKGSLPPELAFHVSQERIEQLRHYLKRRGAGLHGWPPSEEYHGDKRPRKIQKEARMTVEQTHRSKTSLSQGREVIVISTPSQIVLQLQQHKQSDDDLLNPVVNVAASLTPQECVALAGELLRVASPLLEKLVVSNPNSLPSY